MIGVGLSGMTLMNQDRTNQQASSLIGKILSVKGRNQSNKETEVGFRSSEDRNSLPLQPLLSKGESTKVASENLSLRVFVATWNVGGKSPDSKLSLDDVLQVWEESDVYVLGFQEIVPLNAGNVLVIEDNEPAVKWLALINQSLNKANIVPLRGSKSVASSGVSLVFPKTSLRKGSKAFRTESKRRLKSCNCPSDLERKNSKEFCFRCPQSQTNENDISSEDDEDGSSSFAVTAMSTPSGANQMKYGLVASKQMVGIFLTVWMRKELVQHVSHLRISCVGRGILGCLGNKGCISVSMLFHKTSFCFLCCHLASGEKEGDELRRNSDVNQILRNTQFQRICKTSSSRVPEKILDHDRVIWLGDLNYRIALSYSDTGKLLKEKAWDVLYNNDQLKIERRQGKYSRDGKKGKSSLHQRTSTQITQTNMQERQRKVEAKGELQLGVTGYYGAEAKYISSHMNGRSRGFPIIGRYVRYFGWVLKQWKMDPRKDDPKFCSKSLG